MYQLADGWTDMDAAPATACTLLLARSSHPASNTLSRTGLLRAPPEDRDAQQGLE